MGVSTTVMGAAAHHSTCSLVAPIAPHFRGVLAAAGRCSHYPKNGFRNGGISGREVRWDKAAPSKLSTPLEAQVGAQSCYLNLVCRIELIL